MSSVRSEPTMNITGQINKALDDVRKELVALANTPVDEGSLRAAVNVAKARYIVGLATDMVINHRFGVSRPWSELRPMVEEEFS